MRYVTQKAAAPTKVVSMTIKSDDDMALSLLHPNHKTMVIYRSKDGMHRISAMRRSGNKTWIIMDGKVVHQTQLRQTIKSVDWA